MIIDSASYTCPGGHEINEDSFLCRSDKGIFIVADGLGGHSDGEKASGAAIAFFEASCLGGYTEERIRALMEGANAQVLQYGDGGKTTVAAAFIENGNFIYSNVGDSRVYLFRDGKIIAQTKDHSVCQASVDMGMMRFEDIRGSEDRSRLLKVLGGEDTLALKKHYAPIRLQQGDAFLICSDGFWDYVYETEMEADLLKSGSADVWLKYMLKRHILRAQNKGDNYTAICGIVHMEPEDAAPAPIPPTVAYREEEAAERKPFPAKAAIIGAAVGLLIAAVVVIAVILLNGGSSSDDTDISSTPAETSDESAETTPEEEAAPTETEETTPTETVETTPAESEETTPSESEATTPSESEATTPSESEATTPSESEEAAPAEGEVTPPPEGEEPPPPEGDEPPPPEGEEPLPPDGEGPAPPDGDGPVPPEGPPEREGSAPSVNAVPDIFVQP